jgi:hypothetical protein
MVDVTELVELPDLATRPLVHPLDLTETSDRYRFGWLIGVFTSPAVGLLVGVIAWRLGAGYVVPVIAGLSLVGLGALASRFQRDETWAYIPRRRQDRGRAMPPAWELVAGVVSGAAIVLAATLASPELDAPGVPVEVREFIAGGAAALAVLVGIDVASSATLRRGSYVGRPWFALPIVVAVIAAVVVASSVILPPRASLLTTNGLLGCAMMLLVGLTAAIWQSVRARRVADPA